MSYLPPATAIRRFSGIACLTLAALLFAGRAHSQSLALTFDDGPNMADEVGMRPADRNAAILRQLAAAHTKSTLFVAGTDSDPRRNDLIRQWGIQGHAVANHT